MTDSSLRYLQSAFAQALLDGHHVPANLVRGLGLSPRQRLNVYYHHSRIVQQEALKSIYPAVERLVGDDFFANMAILYGEQHPLTHGDVRTFGGDLPDFIEGFQPLASLPYLPDVARLEWACHASLHHGESVTTLFTESCRLRLARHVRLLLSPYPVAQIWEFALKDQASRGEESLDIGESGPEYLLIARPRKDVEVYTLPAEEWQWLERLGTDAANPDDIARRQYWHQQGILVADHDTDDSH